MRSANTICRCVSSRMHSNWIYDTLDPKVSKWRSVIIWWRERSHVWVTFGALFSMKRRRSLYIDNNWVKNTTKRKRVPSVCVIWHNRLLSSRRRWMRYTKETLRLSSLPSKYSRRLWAQCSICSTSSMAYSLSNSGMFVSNHPLHCMPDIRSNYCSYGWQSPRSGEFQRRVRELQLQRHFGRLAQKERSNQWFCFGIWFCQRKQRN